MHPDLDLDLTPFPRAHNIILSRASAQSLARIMMYWLLMAASTPRSMFTRTIDTTVPHPSILSCCRQTDLLDSDNQTKQHCRPSSGPYYKILHPQSPHYTSLPRQRHRENVRSHPAQNPLARRGRRYRPRSSRRGRRGRCKIDGQA